MQILSTSDLNRLCYDEICRLHVSATPAAQSPRKSRLLTFGNVASSPWLSLSEVQRMQCHSHGQVSKAISELIYSDTKTYMILLLIDPYC